MPAYAFWCDTSSFPKNILVYIKYILNKYNPLKKKQAVLPLSIYNITR